MDSWREVLLPFASSHWASHPSVSVFALSWQQRYDRSWVGVRDELWGNGQDFTRRTGSAHVHETRQRRVIESREGFDTEEEKREYLSPPLSARGHNAIVLFSWPQISQAIYLCRGSCLVNSRPACAMCVLSFVRLDQITTPKAQHKEDLKILISPVDPQWEPMKRITRWWKWAIASVNNLICSGYSIWREGRVCVCMCF